MSAGLIAARAVDSTPRIPGSVKQFCTVCGYGCWISPQSQAMLDDGATLYCMVCAVDAVDADPHPTIMAMTDGQRAELRAVGLDDAEIERVHKLARRIYE